MSSVTISIPVNPELADVYATATDDERERVKFMLSLVLRDIANPRKPTLKEMMDRMSDIAQERGLTPEILEELLADDE